ncbi:hypothetical protein ACWC10_22770 [Streptomyces sp. NPDC001595]|uniref:hypothetical protein n=1 Tax=Streptomyces sp. NPDC001532 TaxID=3154520 RepID=UPI00332AA074
MDQIGEKPEEVRKQMEKEQAQARAGKKGPKRGTEREGAQTEHGESAQDEAEPPTPER